MRSAMVYLQNQDSRLSDLRNMIALEKQKVIIDFIDEEARRIGFGIIIIEVNVMAGHLTNIQAETKRSMNIDRDNMKHNIKMQEVT